MNMGPVMAMLLLAALLPNCQGQTKQYYLEKQVTANPSCVATCEADGPTTRCIINNMEVLRQPGGCVWKGSDTWTLVTPVTPFTQKPKACTDVNTEGVNTIYPYTDTSIGVSVYCNLSNSGGGWTVLQKRYDGSLDFYRTWAEYEVGFGNPAGEHWLGLAALHAMTNGIPTELYIGLTDYDNVYKYAKYGTFSVMDSANKYQLTIGSYSGTAGDDLDGHSGSKFSTHDQDNDGISSFDCAVSRHGAWWYSCGFSNLNGQYSSTEMNGQQYMFWVYFSNSFVSLKTSVMMFRPLSYSQA